MEQEQSVHSNNIQRECPECGAIARLYRTPKGLRCAECVKRIDSGGLTFR